MTLPAQTKTWQITRGRFASTGSAQLDHQTLLYNFNTAMLGFSQNPWLCDGSGTGGTFGMDGTNRWTSPGAITTGFFNSTNVGWSVLRQPALNASGSDARVLLGSGYGASDMTTYNGLYVRCSLTGAFPNALSGTVFPTGGFTFLAPPQAGVTQFGQPWFHGQTSTVGTIAWVAMMTTDGKNTRLLAWVGPPAPVNGTLGAVWNADLAGDGRCVMYASFEELVDCVPGTQVPYAFTWQTGTVTDTTGAISTQWQGVPLSAFSNVRANTSGNGTCYVRPVGTDRSGRWSLPGCAALALGSGRCRPLGEGDGPNVFDGGVDGWQVAVAQNIAGVMHEIGVFPDLYVVPELGTQSLNANAAAPDWCQGPPGLALPCGGALFNTGV